MQALRTNLSPWNLSATWVDPENLRTRIARRSEEIRKVFALVDFLFAVARQLLDGTPLQPPTHDGMTGMYLLGGGKRETLTSASSFSIPEFTLFTYKAWCWRLLAGEGEREEDFLHLGIRLRWKILFLTMRCWRGYKGS